MHGGVRVCTRPDRSADSLACRYTNRGCEKSAAARSAQLLSRTREPPASGRIKIAKCPERKQAKNRPRRGTGLRNSRRRIGDRQQKRKKPRDGLRNRPILPVIGPLSLSLSLPLPFLPSRLVFLFRSRRQLLARHWD